MDLTRKAKRQDSKRIWEIRNHPVIRKVSGSSEEFSFDQHDSWFENKYFKDSNNVCYILESDSIVVGYCRFDFNRENDDYIISIALDPNYHGKGLGNLLLSQSLKDFGDGHEILAEVKKENIVSLGLFQKNDFELFREDEKNYYLKIKY